jgi:cation diffusion facilitator CzcD-associated flavoprotein CzcO
VYRNAPREESAAEVYSTGYEECGGVWHANKYPGCRCDVPSAAYQFSFAPSPDWPKYYSPAKDIKAYYSNFARDRGYVEKYIKLSHEVVKAEWNEAKGKWILDILHHSLSGESIPLKDEVDFLVGNIGVLNTWKWPEIPQRETYTGRMTHSADYDTSIETKDKTVIVIGSGASSIQIIPAISKDAAKVVCFYRTPQWISTGLAVEGYTDPEGRNFACK